MVFSAQKNQQMQKLNKKQLQAIRHKDGPLLVIAGAGTGKTTVITERIKFLISKDLAKPNEILALTFTEKAAHEMEERVDIAMPMGYTQMWIMTFHGFCDHILREDALHIGLDPEFKLLSQTSSIKLLRDNMFNLNLEYFRPLGNPNKFVKGLLTHFSRLQDENITPEEYIKWAKEAVGDKEEVKKWNELAQAYRTFEELKIKKGYMDFGDLITKTLLLFKTRPNILKKYQQQFKYILVDEFQDTNFAQNELAMVLAGKKGNIMVTGDDDQSIYRFRGAAVTNIIHFRKRYPETGVVVLTENYRSTQEILDRSYDLIQFNNPDRLEVVENIDKRLISQRKQKGKKIKLLYADRVENEADMVAKEIEKLSKAYSYKDFAILVRANAHAQIFTQALLRRGIPHQFLGPEKLFSQPEVLDLISYLKVLNDPLDSVSFYRFLSINHFDISARDIAVLGSMAKHKNTSLFETAENTDTLNVSEKTKKKIKYLLELIDKHLKLKEKESAGRILFNFLQETKLLERLLKTNSQDDEKIAANISKFFDKLKSFELNNEETTISAVVDWLDLSGELGESPLAADTDWTEENAVNLLTIHSAKGLEFPVVFLVNLVSQRFPSSKRSEQIPLPDELIKEILPAGDFHLEEERRLCYVGMTRAKDRLFLTAANFYGEGKRSKRLSPFIIEALGKNATKTKAFKNRSLPYNFHAKAAITKSKIKKPNVNYLSYSQIEAFQICPLHYKLKFILNIPHAPSAALSFGSTIHEVMKDFYKEVANGKKPTKKLLKNLLERNWTQEGFKNKSHEKKYYQRAIKYLEEYLKQSFDIKNLPLALEEKFTVPLNKSLKIGGRIDRIDKLSNGKIEIIDYKTGEYIPTQKEVDQNKQLSFYALAATQIPQAPFVKNIKDIVLSLYYFEKQIKLSTTRTSKDLKEFKKEILRIRKEIINSDFTCSGHFLCQNCEYSMFCKNTS